MQLTGVQYLTKDYTQDDIDELVAVVQSTISATPSTVLRWQKVNPSDAERWLRQSYARAFTSEFQLRRLSTLQDEDGLPTTALAEHLVIRDLDMEHLNADSMAASPGRIVAHADYKFMPSFDILPGHVEDIMATDPTMAPPEGFGRELHNLLFEKVVATLVDIFQGLPCFGLEGISTLTPSHVRKGIAKRMVTWVFPYSDHFSLPVILAASPLGLPLYQNCGFDAYRDHDIVIDLQKFGGQGTHRHVIMVRWPKNIDKLPTVWKAWREAHQATS